MAVLKSIFLSRDVVRVSPISYSLVNFIRWLILFASAFASVCLSDVGVSDFVFFMAEVAV